MDLVERLMVKKTITSLDDIDTTKINYTRGDPNNPSKELFIVYQLDPDSSNCQLEYYNLESYQTNWVFDLRKGIVYSVSGRGTEKGHGFIRSAKKVDTGTSGLPSTDSQRDADIAFVPSELTGQYGRDPIRTLILNNYLSRRLDESLQATFGQKQDSP